MPEFPPHTVPPIIVGEQIGSHTLMAIRNLARCIHDGSTDLRNDSERGGELRLTRDNTETRNSIPNESGGIESEGGTKSSKVAGRGQLRDQTSIRRPSVLTQAIRPLATVFIAHYPVMFCMSEDDPERTPEEQAVIDEIADSRGEEFVEEHDELILDQARLVGEL